MGFRSYIRHFLVAMLMLFRPSGPCCLSVAEVAVSDAWKFPSGSCLLNRRSSKSRSSSSSSKEEKVAEKSSFSMGFRSYIRQYHPFLWVSEITLGSFWSQFWCFSVLQGPAVWAWRRRRFWAWKSREFLYNFDAFPSFTAMVFSHPGAVFWIPSGSCLLNRRSSKSRSSSSRRKK